jgi:hypothetical protein
MKVGLPHDAGSSASVSFVPLKTFRVHGAAASHQSPVSTATDPRCASGLSQLQPMAGPQVGEDLSEALALPAIDFQKASAVGL